MGDDCCCGMCTKCHAGKYIVVGLILLANYYWLKWDIWVLIGALLVLKGLLKLVKPNCPHCGSMSMKKSKK